MQHNSISNVVASVTILDNMNPWGLATLVVVEVPSTCQDSHLVGKRGASQGSPLRVAPGVSSGSGWGPRALYKAMMRSTITSSKALVLTDAASSSPIARPCLLGCRGVSSCACWSGHSPFIVSTSYRGYGVGGPHKTTTLITVLLAASAATASSRRKIVRLFIGKSLMERKQYWIHNCLSTHSLEIEVRERNVLSESRVHSALKLPQIRGVCSDWFDDQVRVKLVVLLPATVGLGLCSCSTPDSLFTALELSVFKPCSVRPAQDLGCSVTVCGSHVKSVIKFAVQPLATVGLGLCS